ncbi:Sterol 3-beta-glucosyltransferase [Golovinomyces cichoracearum]|uniref:Sterol 3-beta-glucosyltransferase n=1 Tax=Golovinomyces cichoracearum TaxID=62708 RepID=A0A420J6Y6_9PEZI|nr:Sterol 3-beta-glucosyltransferase [Golovinomyces cichoracearum]
MTAEKEPNDNPIAKAEDRGKDDKPVTLKIPERFQDEDDAEEDCTALSGANTYMSQSVFGMIAAASPQVNFNTRFHAQSSDDEEDGDLQQKTEPNTGQEWTRETSENPANHQRKSSHYNLLRSISGSDSKPESKFSRVEPPRRLFANYTGLTNNSLPRKISKHDMVMSRLFEARAEMCLQPSSDLPSVEMDEKEKEDHLRTSLSKKLREIFLLETEEEVIEEYPCWLMKSILLQGYMYIMKKHICFYAYLPRKSNEVVKSGYLFKSGRRNPKFNRYWFRLKGDFLSYYNDPSDLYFLRGGIDLRYSISASVTNKVNSKDSVYFSIHTHQRDYKFKADSASSAKDWVKALQRIIFRSHNEGDSVKISIPIDNIMDIEESQIIDFADTCKIRVVDNGDTYAVDEYFFSFFSLGKEALGLLRKVVEDTTAQHIPKELLTININEKSNSKHYLFPLKRNSVPSQSEGKSITISSTSILAAPYLEENVRATLSPIGAVSPRSSMERNRTNVDSCRKSFDLNYYRRRSIDQNIFENGVTNQHPASAKMNIIIKPDNGKMRSTKRSLSESCLQFVEDPKSLNLPLSYGQDTLTTGSQILNDSEVFLSPTIQKITAEKTFEEGNSPPREIPIISAPRKSTESVLNSPVDLKNEPSISAPTLHSIVKVGAYPLQRAAGFAGYLNKHSKRVGNLLATESIGYVEKVSGMWKGGKKHYDEEQSPGLDGFNIDGENEDVISSGERFRDHFSLPETERLQAAYFGFLNRVIPLYGKIYISDRSFCFRSLLPATSTKLILPLTDIENVDKEKGFRFGYSGLVVVIKAHEELFFEFPLSDTRDDCAITLLQNIEAHRQVLESDSLSCEEKKSAQTAVAEHLALQQTRSKEYDSYSSPTSRGNYAESAPITFDDPRASILNFKPIESLYITCLTIGSRGDVQPYIALCKGLIAEGHRPRIATHIEFKDWVESYGIDFKPVSGDPAELMRICIENGMFTYSFLREASSKFRGWVDELLKSSWIACQGSDLLIESPSAMSGIHIAEALEIPYFRAFTMPWTRTRAYPHAFAVPEHKMGGAYNYITYVMFDNIFWKAISSQINWWRKKQLGLQSTNLEKMQPNKVPFLYNFSPAVVVPPPDYSDWIRVTGYWFLDEGSDWKPSEELTEFIEKAKKDEKKIVYIGFGSIIVQDSVALMNTIIKSVEKADIRCILSRGWSDRLDKKESKKVEPQLPPSIIQIRSAPHDWLFKQIDAAAHHGGAGTTGASLRAGLPTIIKPFFGDQYFFGSRVEDLGVGITMKKLNVSIFSRALWQVCNDERMIIKARLLGKTIRKEDGVGTAIQAIYRDLDYAKSLIKRRDNKMTDDVPEDSEESWTVIGEENDSDLVHHRLRSLKSKTPSNCLTLSQEERDDHESDICST